MAEGIIEINQYQYENEVMGADQPVVVDFYSTECPPCEALATKYESLAGIYGADIKFVKIFRQGNRELSEKLDVQSSPTVFFVDKGVVTGERFSGGIKRASIERNLRSMLSSERVAELEQKIERKETEVDVLVLGAGPAGLTAAIYTGQAHLSTIVVDPALPGGQVSTTHQVSNYPGFIDPVPGYLLSHNMAEQAKVAGVEFRAAVDISEINLQEKSVLVDGIERIRAKALILSTGSAPRALNVPGEREYKGQGISYCATCDAKYFEGKEAIVIGGGNSAIEESLFIAKFASKITIVHQFDSLQANKDAQEKAFAEPKINFVFDSEPREFLRNESGGMSVRIENVKTGDEQILSSDGVFVFVGMRPNVEEFEHELALDEWGYVKTDDDMLTSIPSVYAVGDVKSKKYRQITIAVGEGTVAGINVSRKLA